VVRVRFRPTPTLTAHIVKGIRLREPGIDFQTAETAGLAGLLDPEVIEKAGRENRILVSHDKRTMSTHFGQFLSTGQVSPGLFIVTQQCWDDKLLGTLKGYVKVVDRRQGQRCIKKRYRFVDPKKAV
jgi:hypothetical protein